MSMRRVTATSVATAAAISTARRFMATGSWDTVFLEEETIVWARRARSRAGAESGSGLGPQPGLARPRTVPGAEQGPAQRAVLDGLREANVKDAFDLFGRVA